MTDPNQPNDELDAGRLDDENEDMNLIAIDDDSDDEPFHLQADPAAVGIPGVMRAISLMRDRLFRQFIQDEIDQRRFDQTLRVFSVVHLDLNHQNLESSGKVFLPPSALVRMSRSNSALPMMFKTTNLVTQKYTHCGVLEFTAEEERCYMPTWMMTTLGVVDNDEVRIERVNLPVATFAKFQPQSVDFLDVTNPKAMLENCLRTYACLTKGDVLAIHYNNHVYQLLVLELSPRNAVSIIECDMNVDFAPPLGHDSPSETRETEEIEEDDTEMSAKSTFIPFTGIGNRINGKPVKSESVSNTRNLRATRGQPDHEWRFGMLKFARKVRREQNSKSKESQGFRPFEGAGQSIWKRRVMT